MTLSPDVRVGPVSGTETDDRRRFPRVQAPVLYRPAGLKAFHHPRRTTDVSLGGIRVYSDEYHKIGANLDLDVILPDKTLIRCWTEVVWIEGFAGPAGTSYDVGLRFTDIAAEDLERLASVLLP